MVFGFSTEDFNKKMKAEGSWKVDINRLIRNANKRTCFRSTPKYRRDCLNGKRMLLSQARKVVESGFIKTELDYDELARDFHMDKNQVNEALSCYLRLMNEGLGCGRFMFKDVEELFNSFIVDDEIVDYHWSVWDEFFKSKGEYAMSLSEATHTQRKETYYFCLMMTKLAGGDFFVSDGFVKARPGFGGERYVRTVYDLSWFLAGKALGLLDDKVAPSEFFSEKENWKKFNKYSEVPAYITSVMEERKMYGGKLTFSDDIEGMFEEREIMREMLVKKIIGKREYLDIKLLEWATRVKECYDHYTVML